jgi:DNA-binding GntR family transcriptional regulator
MTFKAPESLSEQIAQHLARRIIRGELRPGERIQEQKVTLALNVSRGSVREALLILERRHLIAIIPRRGAQVTRLTEHRVRSLCSVMTELYTLLAQAVAHRWDTPESLQPLQEIRARLQDSYQRQDVTAFVEQSFSVLRAAYPFADNPYLQETIEDLQPAMDRHYHLALEQRKTSMGQYLELLDQLLEAVRQRDPLQVRAVLASYGALSCTLTLTALASA